MHNSHGLSLQTSKTEIIPIDTFETKYLKTPQNIELDSLTQSFQGFVEQLGLENPYEPIDYDALEPEAKEVIDSLNLGDLLDNLLSQTSIDLGLFKFILRRLGQLNQPIGVNMILASIDKCYHAIPSIVSYLNDLTSLEAPEKHRIGQQIIRLLEDSLVSKSLFNRCCLLSLFAESNQWGQEDQFLRLYGIYPDSFPQRKLILAMGRARQQHWFRRMRSQVLHINPWSRRAFLAAASCMAPDEMRPWYSSIVGRVDDLDRVIIKWARSNPF